MGLDQNADPTELFMRVKPFSMRRKRKKAQATMFDPSLIFSSQYVDDQIKTCKIRKLTPRGSMVSGMKLSPRHLGRSPPPGRYGAASCYDYLLPERGVKSDPHPRGVGVKLEPDPHIDSRSPKIRSPKERDVATILGNMTTIHRDNLDLGMPTLEIKVEDT